jgi:hypothetical protein
MSRTGMHTFLRQEKEMRPPFFHFLALTFGSIGSITSSYASSVTMDSTSLKSEAANLAFDACSLTFRASSFPSRFVRCQQVLFFRCENKSFSTRLYFADFLQKDFSAGAHHFVSITESRQEGWRRKTKVENLGILSLFNMRGDGVGGPSNVF